MARTCKLSAVEVAKAKRPAVLHDGGGLYLRVSATGTKSWVFRFQLDGKRRDMGLGPYPDVSLARAREKAIGHRQLRYDGVDPLEARKPRDRRSGFTSRGVALSAKLPRSSLAEMRRLDHRKASVAVAQYPRHLRLPNFGGTAGRGIDTRLVVQGLDPIWAEKLETASRGRGRIEAVLDAATVRGFRRGPNPAQWKGNLAHLLPARARVRKVAHHAALPFNEMPAFLIALRALAQSVGRHPHSGWFASVTRLFFDHHLMRRTTPDGIDVPSSGR
jgi:hypothetical protein